MINNKRNKYGSKSKTTVSKGAKTPKNIQLVTKAEPLISKPQKTPKIPLPPKGVILLKLKAYASEKISKGYPLLMKMDIESGQLPENESGQLLWLIGSTGKPLGTAYYGVQNKGVGWLISKSQKSTLDVPYFSTLFSNASEARGLFPSESTTAYRWFNGEGDGFGGLTIDSYDGHYVFTWYSKGVYSFKEVILKAFQKCVPEYKSIYFKRRFEAGGQYVAGKDLIIGEPQNEGITILENNIAYKVYLDDGPMVGIFLDQREVRLAIRKRYSRNKHILNTFSYTGAFSVAACAGGSRSTVSVDLANRSLSKTREQFEVNHFNLENNQIVVEDVFNYFKYAAKKELIFDTVILDPPSYAKSKKMTFTAEKNYTSLLEDAIAITKVGGVIVASTNCSSFDMGKFIQMANEAFKNTGYAYKILERYTLPSDYKTNENYPEGDYLKVLFLEKSLLKNKK